MSSTKSPRFRPTVWPGQPVIVPTVLACPARTRRREDGVIEFYWNRQARRSEVQLPPDFVLREVFDAELTTDGLAEFMTAYGMVAHTGSHQLDALPTAQAGGEHERAALVAPGDDVLRTELVGLHLRNLRALAAHLTVFFDAGDAADFRPAWVSHGHQTPESAGMAWLWFDTLLNAALRPFHLYVDTGSGLLAREQPTLYQACALQLYNYVAEHVPFARCANESCPHGERGEAAVFTRQRGRSRYGQHRTSGVRFCSKDCAKSQAERERRRRQRTEASHGQR